MILPTTNTNPTTYDDIVNIGLQAKDSIDNGRWTHGDLACLVETAYGEKSMAEFAKDIEVPKSTVAERRTMAAFYPPQDRDRLIETYQVDWSKLRIAKRFKTVRRAEAFFRLCGMQPSPVRTADDMGRLAKLVQGKVMKPKKICTCRICVVQSDNGVVMLRTDGIEAGALVVGTEYNIDVFEVGLKQNPSNEGLVPRKRRSIG